MIGQLAENKKANIRSYCQGHSIHTENGQLIRWKEYFKEIMDIKNNNVQLPHQAN